MLRGSVIAVFVACVLVTMSGNAGAALCWVDSTLSKYSIEVGSVSGSRVELFGYRKTTTSCLPGVSGLEPVAGSAVLVNGTTAIVGWTVHSLDPDNGCTTVRENYTVNLGTLVMTGFFRNDAGAQGMDTLTPTSCPTPADEVTPDFAQPGKEQSR